MNYAGTLTNTLKLSSLMHNIAILLMTIPVHHHDGYKETLMMDDAVAYVYYDNYANATKAHKKLQCLKLPGDDTIRLEYFMGDEKATMGKDMMRYKVKGTGKGGNHQHQHLGSWARGFYPHHDTYVRGGNDTGDNWTWRRYEPPPAAAQAFFPRTGAPPPWHQRKGPGWPATQQGGKSQDRRPRIWRGGRGVCQSNF